VSKAVDDQGNKLSDGHEGTSQSTMTDATKKEKLDALLLILGGVSNADNLRRIPTDGLTDVQKNDKKMRAATCILDDIVNAVCLLLVNEDVDGPAVKATFQKPVMQLQGSNCAKHLVTLALQGNLATAVTAGSVLAKSMQRLEMQNFLSDATANFDFNSNNKEEDETARPVTPGRGVVGKVKFASLRKTYDIIANGNKLPKYNSTFRVSGEKISRLVQFVQEALQVKPGFN
jgi:hypothetical protein